MDVHRPFEMTNQFVQRPPPRYQDPPSLDSQSIDDQLIYTPEDYASAIISNGNSYMTEPFRNYIDDDLNFDPLQNFEDAMRNEENNIGEMLARKKRSRSLSRKRLSGKSSCKFKSQVILPPIKRPTAYLDPTFLKSQQKILGRKRGKSSTNKVIRGWGKRPLLVESEAPWTPRNRMYLNAIKSISRTGQLTSQYHYNAAVRNNFLMFGQQPYNGGNLESQPSSSTKYFAKKAYGNGTIYLNQRDINGNGPSRKDTPYYSVTPTPPPTVVQPQQVVSGMPVDFNSRPLTVAFDPQQNGNYVYHPGMVPLPPSPQSFVYEQLNSQGLWVPLMGQPPMPSGQIKS